MPQAHPVFQEPANRAVKVWRYMDFPKFLAMIEDKALFFARVDQLADPFEGSFPQPNLDRRPEWYGEIIKKYEERGLHVKSHPGGRQMTFLEFQSHWRSWLRQWTFVNCWHINEAESAAMWKLYASTNQAVALQSTYERLRSCLPEPVLIGEVRYLNYQTDVIPEDNVLWPCVHKRASFSHERELRAVILDLPSAGDRIAVEQDNLENGRLVPVNLQTLVEQVCVAPSSPAWYADLVRKVIARYCYTWPVATSGLDARPLY